MTIVSPTLEVFSKPWYASRAIWGSIVTLLSAAAGFAGYSFAPEDVEALTLALSGIGATLGSILAIFGRIWAAKAIK